MNILSITMSSSTMEHEFSIPGNEILDPSAVQRSLDEQELLSNCLYYPIDEAPDAYKDFREVLASVEKAALATEVAKRRARFVIKDPSS